MYRKMKISGLLAAALLAAAGCQDDFYVFEDSASERIEQGLAKYDQALLDGRTWVMEYFPSEELEYGGWIYVLRFNDDHTVRAWFEGETFADDTNIETPYAVEHSTGPMLKFVNYNDYLHYFAFPGGNGSGFQGYEGDYEFSFMEITPDNEIIMRGIKTENDIILRPLPDGYTPEEYVAAVREWQADVAPTSLKFMVNGKQYGTFTRESTFRDDSFEDCYKSKLWTIHYTYRQQKTNSVGEPVYDEITGEPVYEDVNVSDELSFIHYPDGTMCLYEPYTFKGEIEGLADQTIQTLKWEKGTVSTADYFVCTDSLLEIRFEQ